MDTKLTGKPMAQRITDRLKNSGAGANPDVTVTKGEGPLRTHSNLHFSGHQHGLNKSPSIPAGRDILGDYGPESSKGGRR